MRSLINEVDIVDVLRAISSAISRALASVASGVGRSSENKSFSKGCSAGYARPVVATCRAREWPISLGRKNEDTASMIIPRRENTKPIFAFAVATRMVAGSVMVMPIPTADPLMAAIVGFRQLCIARAILPPLHQGISRSWDLVV